jgi:multiple sugar transport system permease protein
MAASPALATSASSARARRAALHVATNVVIYAVLIVLAIAFLLPFAFMVSTALKPGDQIYSLPVTLIPYPPQPRNFVDAVSAIPFGRFAINTATITAINLVGETLASAIVAYGFARMRFVGRDAWFMVVLATMMLPQQVTLIPLFILYKQLGWIDTFYPLIVPTVLGGSPFYIFLLRQFFMGIPADFEDAARIDGATSWSILTKIFLPLSKPALASVLIFAFMFHWNDFFHPLIFLSSTEKKTLALGLALFKGEFNNTWNWMMAASTLVLLPCVAVFFAAQRYFVEGITMSGLKG